MWGRLVSQLYLSGITSLGVLLLAAALANSPAFSLPAALEWAMTHRAVTSLSLAMTREKTSEAATAKRCPGPSMSALILSMAVVESEKTVYCRPLSCRSPRVHRARQIAKTSASNTSLLVPRRKRWSIHPAGVLRTHAAPIRRCLVASRRSRWCPDVSTRWL